MRRQGSALASYGKVTESWCKFKKVKTVRESEGNALSGFCGHSAPLTPQTLLTECQNNLRGIAFLFRAAMHCTAFLHDALRHYTIQTVAFETSVFGIACLMQMQAAFGISGR